MVQTSTFSNHHVEAYLEGRLQDIPEDILPIVKDIAERRSKAQEAPTLDHAADASKDEGPFLYDLKKAIAEEN